MPYLFLTNKIPMPRDKDRRVKLTDQDRQEIIDLSGHVGAATTGKLYGVSKRLIQFIRDPEKKKRNLELRQLRGGSMVYYDKDKSTKSTREHRQYKQRILKERNLC